MYTKLASLAAFLILFSACKKAADISADARNSPNAASPRMTNLQIQSEFAGAAVLKETPEDLQDVAGQTPIDIRTNNTVKFQSEDPVFHYEAIDWDVVNNATTVNDKVERNLKAVVPAGDTSNYILLQGHKYNLLQFHFHYASEHAINGTKGDMEVHLVHQDPETKKLAVLGVIIYRGARSKYMGEIFEASPLADSAAKKLEGFNPFTFIPDSYNNYYTYSGSLTTPGGGVTTEPYLEGLTWIVFNGFQTVNEEQLAQYKEIYEEPNSRELQPVGDRKVYRHVGYVPSN
jgi:carbonic anhydrase